MLAEMVNVGTWIAVLGKSGCQFCWSSLEE
jgi:hypothetical protein